MKLGIVFEDGKTVNFRSVKSFSVTEEQGTNESMNVSATDEQVTNKSIEYEISKYPAEGKIFEVDYKKIDRKIFEKPREDREEEKLRQIIQEAFAEVEKYPEKYDSPFYTLIPKKKGKGKKAKTLEKYANDLGGSIADWVEQALEWAQRIANGVKWDHLCNYAEYRDWYRLIVWKNGCYRRIGGSIVEGYYLPTFFINPGDYQSNDNVEYTVPLVVFKKKSQ